MLAHYAQDLCDVRLSAMMLVAGLSDPRMKIEIQVIAYRRAET
jgi:enamine deaminase RidA (YjgF/YER057c/UK114 family)